MSERSDSEAIEAAKSQTTAMIALAAEVKRLGSYGRTNRKFVVIDVLLTVLLAGVGGLSVHAETQASQNRTAQIVTCQSSNQARAENEQLWNYLLALSTSQPSRPGETAAQKADGERLVALLHARIEKTFAARNCEALASGKR